MHPKVIFITGAAAAVIACGLYFTKGNVFMTPVSQPSPPVRTTARADATRTQPLVEAPFLEVMAPASESEPIVSPDPTLDILYDSPNLSAKLAAAQQIAARGNEVSFRSIAAVLTATETVGEPANSTLAKELAQILRQMRTPQIHAVATELAYSPSPLLSEVAADAAVASDPMIGQEQLVTGASNQVSPALDATAQAILDAEVPNEPAAN